MGCSCCDFSTAAGQQFNAEKAAKELDGYRRGRIGPTTRLLRDGLAKASLVTGTLLDVGAGVGALTFELLAQGVTSAVAVDASNAYSAAAQEEAARRNRAQAIAFVHGDFVEVGARLSPADVVTLDRVVCCYADYRSLLREASGHAERGLAMTYPRDRWFVRLGVRLENAMRGLRSNAFRTFVHPVGEMHRLITDAGFALVSRDQTAIWAADIYARTSRRPER